MTEKKRIDKWFLNGGRGSGQAYRRLFEYYENKVYALNEKIAELKEENKNLSDNYELYKATAEPTIKELKEQIEKMKLCQNCKFEDTDYLEKPCCKCTRCLGEDIKRNGNTDKWELKE